MATAAANASANAAAGIVDFTHTLNLHHGLDSVCRCDYKTLNRACKTACMNTPTTHLHGSK